MMCSTCQTSHKNESQKKTIIEQIQMKVKGFPHINGVQIMVPSNVDLGQSSFS